MNVDDLIVLVSEHHRELMAAKDLDSDLALAFELQMQEAMSASLTLQPASSNSVLDPLMEPQIVIATDISDISKLQTLELEKFEQERKDREHCEAEVRKLTYDLKRRVHDQNFACEMFRIPEQDWQEYGDNFEKPFGEGCSSAPVIDEPCKLYFKGLISEERIKGSNVNISGIGVAICDPRDNLLLKIHKPLTGDRNNRGTVEMKALIEGLNAALSLNIKKINFYSDYFTLYNQVTRRWTAKQPKIAKLVNQVFLLQRKFEICRPFLLVRNDVKFVFQLARDAIDSQITKSSEEASNASNLMETCSICLEDTDSGLMFAVDSCLHRYCFTCMKQHVEVKVLHGVVPGCPHESCKTQLNVDSCRKFLPPKLVEMMNQRIKEASIPVTEKVYCPYPKCSALMSEKEVLEYANNVFADADRSGVRKCIKCHFLFCTNCKVPWHRNMNCQEYKRLNPVPRAEEAKLKSLAAQNLWRQCVKCKHLIELAEGCYHMTCRCGYEFCYTCGAEWKNKKATCSCPLWDEENILHDNDEDDDDDEEDDYFDEDDEYGYDAYYSSDEFDNDIRVNFY